MSLRLTRVKTCDEADQVIPGMLGATVCEVDHSQDEGEKILLGTSGQNTVAKWRPCWVCI